MFGRRLRTNSTTALHVFSGLSSWNWLTVPVGLAVANALVWTLFALLGGNVNLHADAYEAFVWGREFQLGYYKHPPFWAWITGGWFSLFPHTDWAFYLLSELNGALGLLGVWALLGRFTKGPERLAGTLLLLLTSFYTFNALCFNANTVQLSLWPWTLYFFIRSLETRTVKHGIWFGTFAAFGILSKYSVGLLLASCFFAVLVRKDLVAYLRSAAPWSALASFTLWLAPHGVWLWQNHFLPFDYAANQVAHDSAAAGTFFMQFALYLLLPGAVIAWHRHTLHPLTDEYLADTVSRRGRVFMTVLSLLPVAITVLMALLGYRIVPHYVLPFFPLIPFMLFSWVRLDARRVAQSCKYIYAVVLVLCLAAAPFIPGHIKRPFKPIDQITTIAFDEWARTTSAPLRIIAGSQPYSEALTFYAKGDVAEFSHFNSGFAPWITPQKLKSEGLLIICLTSDEACMQQARAFDRPGTRVVEKEVVPQWRGYTVPAEYFTLILVPPAST